MYTNVHFPVTAIPAGPVKAPGLCSIKYFKHEDVLTWPAVDPETGIISTTVSLKPGKFIYLAESANPSRSFSESQKESGAGQFFEIIAKASLIGSSAAQLLPIATMVNHQWGLIIADKNGVTRLLGNKDSGADFAIDYSSGQGTESRKTELGWKWQHPQPAPIYSAAAFNIIIGGEILTAGCIKFIRQFEVGATGSPMNQGDTLYINDELENKRALVIVDAMALPTDDYSGDIDWSTSIDRHVKKSVASNTIEFAGGVVNKEKIEIYAIT